MNTVLIAIGFIGLFFVLMSVRLIFIKNGEFKGTCASQSPFLKNAGGKCGFCGKEVGECENEDNLTEVEKVLNK